MKDYCSLPVCGRWPLTDTVPVSLSQNKSTSCERKQEMDEAAALLLLRLTQEMFCCCWVIGIMMTFYKTISAFTKPIKSNEWQRLGRPICSLPVYFWRLKKRKEMMINVIGLFTLPSTWLSHRNEIKMCVEWDFPGKSCKNHDGNKEWLILPKSIKHHLIQRENAAERRTNKIGIRQLWLH